MPRYVIFGSELIEIYPTPSGLHSFIPDVTAMTQSAELIGEIAGKLDKIITQNERIIELLERIAANTDKGKPKDK